jgi:hypothetical protein
MLACARQPLFYEADVLITDQGATAPTRPIGWRHHGRVVRVEAPLQSVPWRGIGSLWTEAGSSVLVIIAGRA